MFGTNAVFLQKKIMKVLMSLTVFILLLTSCGAQTTSTDSSNQGSDYSQNSDTQVVKRLSSSEFKKGVSQENIQIVDVRTPDELKDGKIEGSININFYDSNFKEQIASLDKEKPVYVYCRSGARSSKAMEIMKDLGFKTIYELQGGFMSY